MNYLIIAIYLLLFSVVIPRIPFFRKSGIPQHWLIVLFSLKVAAGIVYGWFYSTIPNYEIKADTWKFYVDALEETQTLKNNPLRFFISVLDNTYGSDYGHFFSGVNSYWNELKHNLMVKIVAIFNLFSGSRYYVNVVFFNFLTFFGPVAFVRIMNDVFPGRQKLITLGTFLFPSFLFWCSGIHKDGIIFTLLSLAVYVFYQALKKQRISVKTWITVALLLGFIFLIRNHVVLAAIPGFAAWWLAEKYFRRKWIAFAVVTVVGTTVFFGSRYVHPRLNLPISITLRQQEFVKLGGESMMPLRKLEPTIGSFIGNAPQALNHAIVRPYITEIYSPLYFLAAMEILVAWLLFAVWFFKNKENPYRYPVILSLMLISMVLLLLTGYIVPQTGAIVRYRALFFPFIMVPLLCSIDWKEFILNKIIIFKNNA